MYPNRYMHRATMAIFRRIIWHTAFGRSLNAIGHSRRSKNPEVCQFLLASAWKNHSLWNPLFPASRYSKNSHAETQYSRSPGHRCRRQHPSWERATKKNPEYTRRYFYIPHRNPRIETAGETSRRCCAFARPCRECP